MPAAHVAPCVNAAVCPVVAHRRHHAPIGSLPRCAPFWPLHWSAASCILATRVVLCTAPLRLFSRSSHCQEHMPAQVSGTNIMAIVTVIYCNVQTVTSMQNNFLLGPFLSPVSTSASTNQQTRFARLSFLHRNPTFFYLPPPSAPVAGHTAPLRPLLFSDDRNPPCLTRGQRCSRSSFSGRAGTLRHCTYGMLLHDAPRDSGQLD